MLSKTILLSKHLRDLSTRNILPLFSRYCRMWPDDNRFRWKRVASRNNRNVVLGGIICISVNYDETQRVRFHLIDSGT